MSQKIITALDVGSSKIATVIVALDNNSSQPVVIGDYSCQSRGVKRGVIVNIEEATDAISESIYAAERMAGVRVSDVIVTINGEHITSINNKGVVAVTGDEITNEDIMRVIENARTLTLPENLTPIHIIPREFIVDKQSGIKYPLEMSGSRLEVETHIITAPNSSLLNLKKCVESAGFNVFDVVFTGWASSLAVLTETERELGISLMDIGAGTTSISIFQDNAIVFSGTVPLGGLNITSDLAIGLNLSIDNAEKVKLNLDKLLGDKNKIPTAKDNTPALLRKDVPKEETDADKIDLSIIGIEDHEPIEKDFLQKIVTARMEEIFKLSADLVAKSGFNIVMPAGIVLTGGTANLYNISKLTKDYYNSPVRIGYPSGLSGMVEEINFPQFSAVQGLIKHGIDNIGEVGNVSSSIDLQQKFSGVMDKMMSFFKQLKP